MLYPQSLMTSEPTGELLLKDESIVISGMSGMYPKARNIKEFADILYKNENAVQVNNGSRWQITDSELKQYVGMSPGIDQFDAQFFTVSYFLGNQMDPMARKTLEHTFQALYDAGLNPRHVYGKKVGVFIGSSYSSRTKETFTRITTPKGFGIIGSAKTMFANRISYWLNIKGPSFSIDESDCSSTAALEQAYLAIRRGDCEAAIVAGTNLCLYPHGVIHHSRLGVISNDGNTRSFSEDANGYVLSDTIGVLILQKAKDALRCYAELLHVKNEYVSIVTEKTKEKYGYHRDSKLTAKFIRDFYDEAQVSPQVVEYTEGYGTGVTDADKSELEAIEEIYCKKRSNTLLIGSVTSNIGLTEASSGIASITKVLLGYHKGELAANLNCEHPRKDILALQDGRMRIVAKNQRFNRTYVAINGMSVIGVNSHVLLYGHYKPKDLTRYATTMPYLVTLSGRKVSRVKNIFNNLKSRCIDAEEVALLHNIHSQNISGYMARGYIILDTNPQKKTFSWNETITHFDDKKRPLWFVYSGMGSQWAGMGAQLMRIPIFATAIIRCQKVLAPYGIDIINIITSPDKSIFDNILHSFVGIAAVQIGLTDILKALGLKPDGIIGHSVGEVGCAYMDGCLTAEETILTSYSRGLVSMKSSFIHGTMAAVGLGYEQISAICPPEIDVACRNSAQSCTIAGPTDVMKEFIAELMAKRIFTKEVPTANIAYHSRYIEHAGPKLLAYLKNVIKNPKIRSERWLSTSVPQNKWDLPEAKYCSAEYHVNNVLNPVLFEETAQLIPSNAMLVEVAPHGLLQAILNRTTSKEWRNIPLTKRGHRDNVIHLLKAIGNIFMDGVSMNLQALYPPVQFPVSTETPMLSHLVEWYHSESWHVTLHTIEKRAGATWNFSQSILDKENAYLRGHVIRQKPCYPFAAALVSVWDAFTSELGVPKRSISVSFQDLRLYAQPLLFVQRSLKYKVFLSKPSGRFEVRSEYSRIISGFIFKHDKPLIHHSVDDEESNIEYEKMDLVSKDIYQMLNDRGYNYTGDFRIIERANTSFRKAVLAWSNNWVTFIDGMLQLNILRQVHKAVSVPICIREICIDVAEHFRNINSLNKKNMIEAYINEVQDFTRSGGVTLQYIHYRNLSISRNNTTRPEIKRVHQNKEIIKVNLTQISNYNKCKLPIAVHFAGLNEFDVSKAYTNLGYGMDYSGVTKSGERIMGLISNGSANTQVNGMLELLWPVPKHWSFEDAATVPFAYTYAFYVLVIKGQLKPGMNVLIHEGIDPLGQAAIAISLAYQCQVLVTVSSVGKKRILLNLFHQLREENIMNSHDIDFSSIVFLNTQGRGFDIAISCVKGQMKNETLKCCCVEGIVIDTVHIQHPESAEDLGMTYIGKKSYMTIEFYSIFKEDKREDMKILQQLLADGIGAGYVVPLLRVTYSPQDVERGIKLLQNNQHRNRVLLRMSDSTPQEITSDYIPGVIEKAQDITNDTLSRNAKHVKPVTLFDQVIALADISIPPNVSSDTTLHDLGVEDKTIVLICKFLDSYYNISLEESEVSNLTQNKLCKLEEYATEFIPIKSNALSTFISEINSDEMLATVDLIVLPTLSYSAISVDCDYEITGQFLCIVPGIEGHHERFRDVCERLKIPALVLQPGLDHPNEKAKETAQRYAKILAERTKMQNHFYLLGYETGVMVAIELAAILENKGLIGTIFCLGYTPKELQIEIQHELREFFTEEQLQNAIISHIYKLLQGENTKDLNERLQNIYSWTEKVDMFMKYILGRTDHSSQFIREYIEVMFVRLVNAKQDFDFVNLLRSKLVVIRAATELNSHKITLQPQLSKQPVITHQSQFPLSCITKDKNCSTIINQYLGADVLEEYELKNKCVNYLIKPE